MLRIFSIVFSVLYLTGCKDRNTISFSDNLEVKLDLEKVVIINDGDSSITYFKIKISNNNTKSIVFMDNSLVEKWKSKKEGLKEGFYLKNVKNDSIIILGIDNYYFYEVPRSYKGYLFLGAIDLKYAEEKKDSILFKKNLSQYLLEYNGKNLDLEKVVKSDYISELDYKEFIKRKKHVLPYKDSLALSIPLSVSVKYVRKTPVSKNEWANL